MLNRIRNRASRIAKCLPAVLLFGWTTAFCGECGPGPAHEQMQGAQHAGSDCSKAPSAHQGKSPQVHCDGDRDCAHASVAGPRFAAAVDQLNLQHDDPRLIACTPPPQVFRAPSERGASLLPGIPDRACSPPFETYTVLLN